MRIMISLRTAIKTVRVHYNRGGGRQVLPPLRPMDTVIMSLRTIPGESQKAVTVPKDTPTLVVIFFFAIYYNIKFGQI